VPLETPRGLCESCAWKREVVTPRSSFVLCARGLTDPAYAKYPRLPVRVCPGHEPRPAALADEAE
jgi:hypothetical protein